LGIPPAVAAPARQLHGLVRRNPHGTAPAGLPLVGNSVGVARDILRNDGRALADRGHEQSSWHGRPESGERAGAATDKTDFFLQKWPPRHDSFMRVLGSTRNYC